MLVVLILQCWAVQHCNNKRRAQPIISLFPIQAKTEHDWPRASIDFAGSDFKRPQVIVHI